MTITNVDEIILQYQKHIIEKKFPHLSMVGERLWMRVASLKLKSPAMFLSTISLQGWLI